MELFASDCPLEDTDAVLDAEQHYTVCHYVRCRRCGALYFLWGPASGDYGSNSLSLTKDTTAPNVSITSPTTGGPHTSGTTVTLSCSDTGGNRLQKNCMYLNLRHRPTSFSGGSTCTISSGTEYSTAATLPNGSYTIKARSCDQAGNISTVSSLAVSVGPPSTPTISGAAM